MIIKPRNELTGDDIKANILEWTAALRSGPYRQGNGHLRTRDDAYCCLGVLCDVSGMGEWSAVTDETLEDGEFVDAYRDGAYGYRTSDMVALGYPNRDVIALVGLTEDETVRLATMNDKGYLFGAIASEIERMTGVHDG